MTPFLCFVEQMFCCQLEELIRWLYNVADVTGSWVPPSPDAESVLASLHRYLVGVTLALLPSPSPVLQAASSGKPGITGMVQGALGLQSQIWEHQEPARRKLLPGQPATGVPLSKTLLSKAALLLALPGVQEGCGRPPEPD